MEKDFISDNNADVMDNAAAEQKDYAKDSVNSRQKDDYNPSNRSDTMSLYKKDCLRLGVFLTVTLLIRDLASGMMPLLEKAMESLNIISPALIYAITLMYSGLCLQILPSILAVFMLKYSFKNICGGFHAPKNTKRAMANFPALYGAAMTVNFITMGIILLLHKRGDISDMVNTTGLNPPDFKSSFVLLFLLAVIAPLFEEFIFRGAVLNLLKPYGNGLAIFVSAFCFGIYHGNFRQFFYAFVLGIALGYIAIATKSLFCSTVIHCLFNSVGGIIMIFVSTDAVKAKSLDPNVQLSNSDSLVMTFYAIFMTAVLLTAVIGFISMINKLRKIKKYSPPKIWGEVGNGKKIAVLMLTVTVIIAELIMIDVMGENYIVKGIMYCTDKFIH